MKIIKEVWVPDYPKLAMDEPEVNTFLFGIQSGVAASTRDLMDTIPYDSEGDRRWTLQAKADIDGNGIPYIVITVFELAEQEPIPRQDSAALELTPTQRAAWIQLERNLSSPEGQPPQP